MTDCVRLGLGQVRVISDLGDFRLHGCGDRRHRSFSVAAARPSEARAAQVALPDQLHPAGVQGADRPRHEGEPDQVGHRPELEVVLPRCHHLLERTEGREASSLVYSFSLQHENNGFLRLVSKHTAVHCACV